MAVLGAEGWIIGGEGPWDDSTWQAVTEEGILKGHQLRKHLADFAFTT